MIAVERPLGSVGFLSLKSWPPRGLAGTESQAQGSGCRTVNVRVFCSEPLTGVSQELEEGSVTTRLYTGYVAVPSYNILTM
eukprot:2351861-Pyramimonas_sp.AAC.1